MDRCVMMLTNSHTIGNATLFPTMKEMGKIVIRKGQEKTVTTESVVTVFYQNTDFGKAVSGLWEKQIGQGPLRGLPGAPALPG